METVAGPDARLLAPLRAARREAKAVPGGATLYEKLKDAELEAERLQQAALAAIDPPPAVAPPSPAAPDRTRRDWAAYARLAGAARRDGFSVSLLEAALAAIFGDVADSAPQDD